MPVTKIISGAQTGADQGGLDAGIWLGLQTGGWIPKGRRTNVGPLNMDKFRLYRLQEHPSWSYPPRTRCNVAESDGTVLFGNMHSPGCKLTISYCKSLAKPYYIVTANDLSSFRGWLALHNISTLNVAGNREESTPGLHDLTMNFLIEALK